MSDNKEKNQGSGEAHEGQGEGNEGSQENNDGQITKEAYNELKSGNAKLTEVLEGIRDQHTALDEKHRATLKELEDLKAAAKQSGGGKSKEGGDEAEERIRAEFAPIITEKDEIINRQATELNEFKVVSAVMSEGLPLLNDDAVDLFTDKVRKQGTIIKNSGKVGFLDENGKILRSKKNPALEMEAKEYWEIQKQKYPSCFKSKAVTKGSIQLGNMSSANGAANAQSQYKGMDKKHYRENVRPNLSRSEAVKADKDVGI